MLWLLARLPVEWARTLGRWSGELGYRLDGRSRRVAERAGFEFEARIHGDRRLPSGTVVDTLIYYKLFDAK